ncbi:unnamed protein product [Allacma fusca]|uniref:C-type lectin domain-containing protein n=1 Tax=Allacma fusca TaxID=39272 RepID=A0A8J2K6B9_9HEXA|nr:unnamed protein product [Allacma fusca]
MTDRLYKQLEAFAICGSRREDFRLAEIDSPEKILEVREFLLRTEYATAWIAGRTGVCPFRDYVWGEDVQERPMNYTNWRKTPAPGDITDTEWCQAGIIVSDNPPAKWELVHQDSLHHALCELYK